MSAAGALGASNGLYEALEGYNWDDDAEFQSGLSAILGSNSPPEQAVELTLRARCFYYARYGFVLCGSMYVFGTRRLMSTRKYNVDVDFDAYKAYRSSRPQQPPAPQAIPVSSALSASAESAGGILPGSSSNPNEPAAPYPTSFAQIVELISSGKPVPGIKEIPNTVLTGQGTQAAQARRKKPWEKNEQVASES